MKHTIYAHAEGSTVVHEYLTVSEAAPLVHIFGLITGEAEKNRNYAPYIFLFEGEWPEEAFYWCAKNPPPLPLNNADVWERWRNGE